MNQSPSILIVDDDPSVRRALGRLLVSAGWAVEEISNGGELLESASLHTAGCIVLDVDMPKMNGLEVQKELIKKGCQLPIIFLTAHGDIPMTVHAVKAGAIDFLSKPCDANTLLAAVDEAIHLYQESLLDRADSQEERLRIESLTPREHEVMLAVAKGSMNKVIASDLGIAEKTVKVHRGRVMRKLKVSSVAELVQMAVRNPS